MTRAGPAGLVSLLTTASAADRSPSESSATPVVRVAHLGAFGFGDLPALAAHERLRARGDVIESTYHAAGDLPFQAPARVARAWVPDGGLQDADVERTLAFFSMPALSNLSAGDVADLRFLRNALESEAP